MTVPSPNAEIRATAQRWFARLLAHDCSQSERAAFARWRAADPAHDAAYRQIGDIWERSARLREDPAIAMALAEARRPVKRHRPAWSVKWLSLAAAAAAVVVLAATASWKFWPAEAPAIRYATALGQQRTIALEDGSQVVLDTDTELTVRFNRRARDLVLARGRADFTVHHDAKWPFVVRTAQGSVTATGTRFQVRVQDGTSTVALLQGRVKVATKDDAQLAALAPDQSITLDAAGRLGELRAIPDAELGNLRGWTQGNLVIKGWPLSTVLAEMNRYSRTKLRLGDPSLGSTSISGVFKAGDQQSFAMALEYGWPIHADQRPAASEIVLTRR
ncbi:FecR family protein [Dyella jiangningensis]|nr:FecR domain-containing protein [Dyella jiangningensis]